MSDTLTVSRIAFTFSPHDAGESSVYAVEKEESGRKRRYLEGVSSGLDIDGAGERMTEKAIASFHKQANSGDVLLYAGKHGVEYSDDIGKLVQSSVDERGDWHTVYRLYDEADGFGPESVTLQKCDKVWRQVNGIAPYTRARKKGFSVEGVIPDGKIVQLDEKGHRAMDDVELDGVVLVNRPAYKNSVARAVFKALGLLLPSYMRDGLASTLRDKLKEKMERDDYYERYYAIQGALDEKIHQVMNTRSPERDEQLRTLFAEYGDLMVDLIMRSEAVFLDADGDEPAEVMREDRSKTVAGAHRLVRLQAAESIIRKMLEKRRACPMEDATDEQE